MQSRRKHAGRSQAARWAARSGPVTVRMKDDEPIEPVAQGYSTPRGQRYARYIQSKAWAQKRAEYWAKYGRSCKKPGCETQAELHVHHHTYARLGEERLTDLVGLCAMHHAEVHARHDEGGRRRSLTLVTEEVTGLKLRRDATKLSEKKQSPKAMKQSNAMAKKPAPTSAGKQVSPLDSYGNRSRDSTPRKRRTPVKAKGQKKAEERQRVLDQRARQTRLHQQAQKVAAAVRASE